MIKIVWDPQASAQLLRIAHADQQDYIEVRTVLAAVHEHGFAGRHWIGTIDGRYRGYLLRPATPGHVVFVVHDITRRRGIVMDLLPRRPQAPPDYATLLRMAAVLLKIAAPTIETRP